MLGEERIVAWHTNPGAGPKGRVVRDAVAAFVTWLQEAEEEDEDD